MCGADLTRSERIDVTTAPMVVSELGAATLRSSQLALAAHDQRMCAPMNKPKAVTAATHKLARLNDTIPTHGQEYTDCGQDGFEERYRRRGPAQPFS